MPKKSDRLFQNLLKVTEQFMRGRSFQPMTKRELMERLSLPKEHADLFQKVLEHLIKENVVMLSRGKYLWKRTPHDVITGQISIHPRGFGFVKPDPDANLSEEVFIPKQLTLTAVHGDLVEVLINPDSPVEKGLEGRVLSILKRVRKHISGTIATITHDGTLLAYVPLLGSAQRVVLEETEENLRVGDRIVMEVLEWGTKETETLCRFSHFIGNISDPTSDVPAAIEEYELRSDFSTKVLEEVAKLKIPKQEIQKRKDLRDLECITIDPITAKDFDDALNLSKDKKGHYHLGVHIADVSVYVKPGSALDEEAKQRGNSTYFPGICLPMLPKELSDDLCSLKPDVDRLTVSVLMELDPKGHLVNYSFCRSVIKSQKRFTYEEAKEVLDGKLKSPHADTLKLMVELCGHLKQVRAMRGSIEFAIPEVEVIVNEQGEATGTRFIPYDITHQLVEEFMLKANEVVATHLSEQGRSLPFRVHEEPDPENINDFVAIAQTFGYNLSQNPTPHELQELFDEALMTPYGEYLAKSYIKTMRLAVYSAENIGHFGLSLTHYCHFTSPIRRYIDLVIHRTLFDEDSEEKLDIIAQDCSDRERISARAEMSVKQLKKLRLLQHWKQTEPNKEYEAIITVVKNFGFYFEIVDLLIEGFIHISEIGNDYYRFQDTSQKLVGVDSGQSFTSGDKITVLFKSANLITHETKWDLVGSEKRRPKKRRKKRRK